MATVRQRKRGVWEVRVFAGRDGNGNGKPVQISRTVYGGKKDAERVANAISIVREGEGPDRHVVMRDDPTKTGDRRRVALDEDTVSMLAPLRKQRAEHAPWFDPVYVKRADGAEPDARRSLHERRVRMGIGAECVGFNGYADLRRLGLSAISVNSTRWPMAAS